ncbi:DUF7544 domain-containing protein [Auraticoccus monumenti]|uniref:Glycerophosphoryl diester phosphodiesterase membrane domain-containing protein n=1 Tax=Auraticoccus monumenti TaxID=675864 RepID=A0A1G6SBF8_9ACTN|nr:hypothetical protein [Auraticoccus monumenti]SDD14189.1 hypothetical protein SAMN04489747_0279 [Auraticoccus monumenti]
MSSVTAGPVLERPLELGSAFSTTWQVMRTRYGTFVLVPFLPVLVGLVLGVVVTALLVAVVAGAVTADDPTAAVVAGVVGYAVWLLAIGLVQLRAEGMKAVLVQQTLEGRRPRVGDLWRETRGYWGRALPYFLLVALATTVLLAVLVVPGLLAALFGDPESAIGPAVVVTMVLYLALSVGLVWISVKLSPVTMVLAVERHGGLAAARRAWHLTDGHFWRTLGYTYLASLVPGAIIGFAYVIGYMISLAAYVGSMVSMMTQLTSESAPDLQALFGVYGAAIGTSLLGATLPVLAAILVQPFMSCFVTTYSMDLSRRQARPGDPASPSGGWQPTPYPPQPVQQWSGVPAAPPWAASPYGAGPQRGYGAPPPGFGPPPSPSPYGPAPTGPGRGPVQPPYPGPPGGPSATGWQGPQQGGRPDDQGWGTPPPRHP